jgi:hypothetical protein
MQDSGIITRPVVGSSPPPPHPPHLQPPPAASRTGRERLWIDVSRTIYMPALPQTPSGHVEQLPSGSCRAKVYAGKGPLTGREFQKTYKTERGAQIQLE